MTDAREFPFVPRHPLDADGWREDLKHVANLRGIVWRQGVSAANLKELLDFETRLALIASLFPDEKVTQYQAVTRAAGVAHAAILCQRRARDESGGTIVLAEPGQNPARIEVDDPGLTAPAWLNGMSLALIARDRGALDTLAAPASIEACAAHSATIDPFWQPYCAAFAAAIIEPDAAPQWIEIAVRALGEAHISDTARVEKVHYPLLPLLAALSQRDARAFNAALLDALKRLHSYYTQPDQYRDWNGLFSIPLSGVCAAAYDAGLPVEVRSGYLPSELIAGTYPRELTRVTLYYPLRAIADADEARWFLDLEGIPRANRQHRIVEREGKAVARYEVKGAPGLAHAIADFTLAADESTDTALDVGDLVYLAEVYAGAGAGAPEALRDALQDAIRCIELALRRLPARGEIRFHSQRGRAVYDAEPGRFERERLTAYRDSLKGSLARMGEDAPEPPHLSEDEARAAAKQPPLSEDEARAGSLILMEVIRAQVMPLLEALAHDETGQVVAQIKPRDEDYPRVFVGEAAALARDAYAALWRREPPRTAQSGVIEVKVSLAPAGMLIDENDLSRHFPQGYRAIARWLQPGRVWVAWKYVKPGAQSGDAYNGLVWIDDHWAWFPKPFRVLRTLVES